MTRLSRFGIAVAVCVSAMSLAGCLKAVGGGKLTGARNGGSITTGFQMRCEDGATSVGTSGHVTGQFQCQDHGMNVAFHVDIDQIAVFPSSNGSFVSFSCEALDQRPLALAGGFSTVGTYTPQPPSLGAGGLVQVTIQNGLSFFPIVHCDDLADDALGVQVITGFYATGFNGNGPYNELGCLEKGNFTVFTE